MTAATSEPLRNSPSWIAQLLEMERDGDTFLAREPVSTNQDGRLFGGLIAAQALAAAGGTLADDGKLPHSLHAYFIRGGESEVDVEMVVERTRDGRSFATRRVTALQSDRAIFEMLASFHVVEPGLDHHPPPPPMPPVDECNTLHGPGMTDRFEMRAPHGHTTFSGPPHWMRMRDPVEDDPLIRACSLTFMSDMGLMAAARPPGTPLRFGAGFKAASLDHSVWFHRPFVPDHWHCYHATPVNNVGSRGLAQGSLYDEAGVLVASMTQEALWRLGEG